MQSLLYLIVAPPSSVILHVKHSWLSLLCGFWLQYEPRLLPEALQELGRCCLALWGGWPTPGADSDSSGWLIHAQLPGGAPKELPCHQLLSPYPCLTGSQFLSWSHQGPQGSDQGPFSLPSPASSPFNHFLQEPRLMAFFGVNKNHNKT